MIRARRHDRLRSMNRNSRLSVNPWTSTGLMQDIKHFELMLKFVYRVLEHWENQTSQFRQRIDGLSECPPRHPSEAHGETLRAAFAVEANG